MHAEAAKYAASREQVPSVINMGLETRALGDLLTLTTSAAACIRGVDGLKMRTVSNGSLEGHTRSDTPRDPCRKVLYQDGFCALQVRQYNTSIRQEVSFLSL
ncbi:unnamed protein product [Urochloa humidicola]